MDVRCWSESICPDCKDRLHSPVPECFGCCIFGIMRRYMERKGIAIKK